MRSLPAFWVLELVINECEKSIYNDLLIFWWTKKAPFLIYFTNEFFRGKIDFEWLWATSTETWYTACWSLKVTDMHFICIIHIQCEPPITATKSSTATSICLNKIIYRVTILINNFEFRCNIVWNKYLVRLFWSSRVENDELYLEWILPKFDLLSWHLRLDLFWFIRKYSLQWYCDKY